jgi:ribonuclease VapC
MIVVDSSALLAIALDEPERATFREILKQSNTALISSGSVIEVRMVAYSRGGYRFVALLDAIIAEYRLEIVPPTLVEIEASQSAFVTFGKGSGHPAQLNFGDLFSYALAKSRNLPLLFKGDDFNQTDIEPAA